MKNRSTESTSCGGQVKLGSGAVRHLVCCVIVACDSAVQIIQLRQTSSGSKNLRLHTAMQSLKPAAHQFVLASFQHLEVDLGCLLFRLQVQFFGQHLVAQIQNLLYHQIAK